MILKLAQNWRKDWASIVAGKAEWYAVPVPGRMKHLLAHISVTHEAKREQEKGPKYKPQSPFSSNPVPPARSPSKDPMISQKNVKTRDQMLQLMSLQTCLISKPLHWNISGGCRDDWVVKSTGHSSRGPGFDFSAPTWYLPTVCNLIPKDPHLCWPLQALHIRGGAQTYVQAKYPYA